MVLNAFLMPKPHSEYFPLLTLNKKLPLKNSKQNFPLTWTYLKTFCREKFHLLPTLVHTNGFKKLFSVFVKSQWTFRRKLRLWKQRRRAFGFLGNMKRIQKKIYIYTKREILGETRTKAIQETRGQFPTKLRVLRFFFFR